MKSLRRLTPLFRLLLASLILAIAPVLLYKGASGPTKAQQSPSAQQERQIENTVPKHVPLDIKITKEKEKNWKDLKNENWAVDFELEIKNTGEKPIYFFYLLVFFDVPTEVSDESMCPIYYGRTEIGNFESKPTADDVPINPGESKVFKIYPSVLSAWERGRREKGRRLPTKVRIKFESLSFGDGTGLMFNKAVPYPRKTSQSPKRGPLPQTGRRREKWRSTPTKNLESQTSETSFTGSPSAGKFLFAHSESRLSLATVQPFESCETPCEPHRAYFVVKCYGCPLQNDPMYDPTGGCSRLSVGSINCTIPETGEPYNCPVVNPIICESEPPPPPPPPPPPSPTPPPPNCTSCTTDAQCNCPNTDLHCNYNLGFCVGDYYYGCDEHFVDDCHWLGGYVPVGTCDCRFDEEEEDGGDCTHPEAGGCWEQFSPIVIDIAGNGFNLTNPANGSSLTFSVMAD